MCAAYWRLHRVWTLETFTLNQQIATQPVGSPVLRAANASSELAALPGTALMQRYETRLQNMYARAIRTFKVLKTIPLPPQDDDIPEQDAPPNIELPKEPSPISEHPPETAQPIDSSGAANPGCSRLSGGSPHSKTAAPAHPNSPAKPPAPQPAPPPSQKQSKAAG
jgi:hypothetical protein